MGHEIDICEVLKRSAHPNLAAYHGCHVGGGKAIGLVFKRYKYTLLEFGKSTTAFKASFYRQRQAPSKQ